MDDYKERVIKTRCYVAETKYKAGIFLSNKIAEKRPYYKQLSLREFDCFEEAFAFFEKNHTIDVAEDECLRLNHLYSVRDEPFYTVLSTPFAVGITNTKYWQDNVKVLFANAQENVWVKHNLKYEEAQQYAKMRFCKIWKNEKYYVEGKFPLNKIVTLNDLKKKIII